MQVRSTGIRTCEYTLITFGLAYVVSGIRSPGQKVSVGPTTILFGQLISRSPFGQTLCPAPEKLIIWPACLHCHPCKHNIHITQTCLWNIAGAVDPLLYSSLKETGERTECCRSETERKAWIRSALTCFGLINNPLRFFFETLMEAKAFPFTTTV